MKSKCCGAELIPKTKGFVSNISKCSDCGKEEVQMTKPTQDWEKRFENEYVFNNSELFHMMGSRYVENLRQFIAAELSALETKHKQGVENIKNEAVKQTERLCKWISGKEAFKEFDEVIRQIRDLAISEIRKLGEEING